ncbi:MAG: pilus assembly protein TadG-related protein [Vulcanimicrobiaceae bacterium]
MNGHRGESGQVVPLVAICLTVLLGAAGLAVDVGYLQYQERIQQSAADGAAIAGAAELAYHNCPASNDPTDAGVAAQKDAASNGFTNDGVKVFVTMNNPPSSGSYTSDNCAVEVLVRATHPRFFTQIFGAPSDVTTRAVARLTSAENNGCIYALNGDASLNKLTITAPTCDIMVNGNLHMNSATATVGAIGATGSITFSGTFTEATPGPAVAAIDPCPTISGCASLATSPPATTPCLPDPSILSPVGPGVYCNTLKWSNSTVTLTGGLYVFAGGLQANNATISGSGVTLYFPPGQSTLTTNNAVFNISAPTSGTYAGIALYGTGLQTFNVNSGDSIVGLLYAPNAKINFNNGTYTLAGIIGASLSSNNSSIIVPANPGGGGLGTRHAVLSE